MLDIKYLRENRVEAEKALLKRVTKIDLKLDEIFSLDDQRKTIIPELESLQAERNKFSKTKPDASTIKKMKEVGEQIKRLEDKKTKIESDYTELMSALPNLPANDVPPGNKENNIVFKTYNKKPKFDFKTKDHVQLAEDLNLIDYKRAVKMSGTGYWAYIGDGALLEWALLNYFIEFHRKNKYIFMIPPFLLNEKSAFVSGHLPKFKNDLFWTQDQTCLNATSEMILGNFHRDEILEDKDLPIKYFAFSTCFRREAGGYRTNERGMIRGHQFNKIEMFQLTRPSDSWKAFDELVKYSEKLVNDLGLHFQSVLLAAGDASSAMAKTIDIEVFLPSMKGYKEASSVSNALDYQARRGNIKFKDQYGKKDYVHTLNGSGLATSRIIPAILEQNQQKDGSVKVPKVLQKFIGKKIIK